MQVVPFQCTDWHWVAIPLFFFFVLVQVQLPAGHPSNRIPQGMPEYKAARQRKDYWENFGKSFLPLDALVGLCVGMGLWKAPAPLGEHACPATSDQAYLRFVAAVCVRASGFQTQSPCRQFGARVADQACQRPGTAANGELDTW